MLRFGGVSGLLWSTLNLLVLGGIFNVVGRTSIWYHLIDVGVSLTGVVFYLAIGAALFGVQRRLTRAAVFFGIAGILVKLSSYVTSQTLQGLGMNATFQNLAGMKLFASLNLASSLLTGFAAVTFGAISFGGLLMALSYLVGGLTIINGFLALATQFLGLRIPAIIASLPSYLAIIWVVIMSVNYLYLARAIRWQTGLVLVGLLIVAEYLVMSGFIQLPNLLASIWAEVTFVPACFFHTCVSR